MNIQPRPLRDGKPAWRCEFTAGKDPATGKPRRIRETFRGTKREAERYWAKRQAEIDAAGAGFVKPVKDTLGEYLDGWLRDYGAQHLKPTTRDSYAITLRVHVIPTLGAVPLGDLTAAQVSAWQAEMARRTTPKGKTIAPRTVAYARAILRSALHEAVRLGLIPSNPVDKVRPPRQEKHEAQAFTLAQLTALAKATENDRMRTIFDFTWRTGLRLGEVLGLRWEDVDLNDGTMTVRRNLVRAAGQTITEKPKARAIVQTPKTERGTRTFALPPSAAAILKTHKVAQLAERVKAGERWQDQDLVFPNGLGKPLNKRDVQTAFSDARKAAELPEGLTFHSLRHTFATIGKQAGVDLLEISKAMGHHSPAFTAATYQHVTTESQKEAAARFEAFTKGV